jgi:ABC-type glycerol-3-phosphate transport system substrate-binding protein
MVRSFGIRTTLAVLLACSLTFTVGAGGQQEEAKIPTLRFSHGWDGSDARAPVFQPMLQHYIKSHADQVVIKSEFVLGTDRIQKVQVDIASGDPPDVLLYWASESNIGNMARNGVLLDIDQFFKASGVDRDLFTGWPTVNIDGHYYGIPIEGFSSFMLANNKIFDELNLKIPHTMAELETVTPRLREAGIIPLAVSSKGGDPGHLFFSSISYQFKDSLKDMQALRNTGRFDYPANRSAAQTIERLVKMNALPKDTISSGGWPAQTALFTSGKAAMIYSFPWMMNSFINEGSPEDYVVMDIPEVENAFRPPAKYKVGGIASIVAISRKGWENEAKRPQIIEFVKWLISDEVLSALAEKSGMEISKKVEYDMSALPPLTQSIIRKQQTEELLPLHEAYFADSEDFDFYKRSIDELFAGLPAEDFIQKVQNQLNK